MKQSFFKKIWLLMLTVGPGIFCIGYTIGTGSVTSMAKAGSEFGMQLLWVLFLSVLFAWVLMEAYGRYAVVTGDTAIHSVRKKLRHGNLLALIIVIGVIAGQWTCLSGILGLTSNAMYELFHMFFPASSPVNYWAVLGIAIFLIVGLYGMLLIGDYSFFEKILVIFVTIMGISFFVSMFIVFPPVSEIANGFVPSIPKVPGGKLMVAPLLVADYRKGELDTRSRQFRVLTAIAAIIGLTVPVLGANPIAAQIATQVSQVFVLPFVIGVIFVLVNRKQEMGVYKAGPLLNAGLVAAFIFACFIAYTGIMALRQFF